MHTRTDQIVTENILQENADKQIDLHCEQVCEAGKELIIREREYYDNLAEIEALRNWQWDY